MEGKPEILRSCESYTIRPDEEAKFDALQREINADLFALKDSEKAPDTVKIGHPPIIVRPYKDVKDKFTTEEYFRYLASIIRTPEDVRRLVNRPIMEWTDNTGKHDKLSEAYVTITNGGGDCDNVAWAAKRLLEILGCRNGVDYKPRVIAIGNHAVCIFQENFTGEKVEYFAIDQQAVIIPFENIYEASSLFPRRKKSDREPPREVLVYKEDLVQLHIDLNPETLVKNYTNMGATIFISYEKDKFKPENFLPADWRKYEKLEIHFVNDDVLFYKKGVLFEIQYSDGSTDFYPDGKLCQRKSPDGKYEHYDVDTGRVKQIDYPDGHKEFLDSDGRVIQIDYPDGTKLVYKWKGKKRYLNGKVYPKSSDIVEEFYHENGRVSQREYRSKDRSPNMTEWYDKDGKLIQIKTWDGEVKIISGR